MKRLLSPTALRDDPIGFLCSWIGFMAIVGSLWLLSSLLPVGLSLTEPTSARAIYNTAASIYGVIALSLLGIATGLGMIWGVRTRNVRLLTCSLLINLILRLYAFLVQLIVYGAAFTWVASLTLTGVVLILYLVIKVRTK